MDLTQLVIRAGLVALVVPWLVELLKLPGCANALKDNKPLTRLVALVVVAVGAAIADWVPDRSLTLNTWLPVVIVSAPTAEASYAWITKSILGWAAARKAGA